jgi:hypothetical protein
MMHAQPMRPHRHFLVKIEVSAGGMAQYTTLLIIASRKLFIT